MPFHFSTELTVRFAETDAAGIAHHSAYLVWFEAARVAYLSEHAGGYQALRDKGIESPVVEVNVEYHDAASRVDFTDTLTFTDRTAGQFSFEVAEGASKAYLVTVTYYLADGQIVARDPVTLEKTAFTIPKYVA